LKYGKYTDQSGVERNTVDIIATEMQLLGGREGGAGGGQGGGAEPAPRASTPAAAKAGGAGAGKSGFDDLDDDIPF
jgi:single-strand DNA-binding protein